MQTWIKQGFRCSIRKLVVASGILIAGLMGWTRVILSIQNWKFYTSLGIHPGVWYLVLNGLIIGLVYTLAGILVLISSSMYKRKIYWLMAAGLLIYWIDRIFFATSMEARAGLPFALVWSACLTLLVCYLLYPSDFRHQLLKWKDHDRKRN